MRYTTNININRKKKKNIQKTRSKKIQNIVSLDRSSITAKMRDIRILNKQLNRNYEKETKPVIIADTSRAEKESLIQNI